MKNKYKELYKLRRLNCFDHAILRYNDSLFKAQNEPEDILKNYTSHLFDHINLVLVKMREIAHAIGINDKYEL